MAVQTRPRSDKPASKPTRRTKMIMVVGMEPYNLNFLNGLGARVAGEAPGFELTVYADVAIDKRPDELAKAIQECDCFFASLINNSEQAKWLAEQIEKAQPQVVLVFESMPEIMELNRVGAYSTRKADGSKGEMPKPVKALANLLVKGREEDAFYGYIKLQKFTNRLMRFMPNSGKMADVKHWMTISTYWTNNCEQNVVNMLRFIARELFNYPINKIEEPLDLPAISLWHPDLDKFLAKPKDYLEWEKKTGRWNGKAHSRATIGLIFFRKHLIIGHDYVSPVIRALEQEGLRVLPVAVTGVEGHVAVRDWLADLGIDFLINLLGFPLVGGPAGSTKPGLSVQAATELLSKLDIGYSVSTPLLVQDLVNWKEYGVSPMQQLILYSLPELDGAIAPVVLGGVKGQALDILPDRTRRLARIAYGWSNLKRKSNRDKKVALLVYDYPTGQGNMATAALLDVPATLLKILQRLKADGYMVGDIPASKEKLLAMLEASLDRDSAEQKVAISVEDFYKMNTPEQQRRVEARWGTPPGEIAPLGRDKILLGGIRLGNIYIGVQPRSGVAGDPMRLLFDKENTPHHQYLMFYRWLQQEFQADAIVHVGMHGTAEWMPGLQLGMSADCWPDILLGEIPSLYLYPVNNPSEANIAKRRGYSVIVSHAIPPYARAGLYKEFIALKDLLSDWREGQKSPEMQSAIRQKLDLTHLSEDLAQGQDETFEAYAGRVWSYLGQMEQSLIVGDMHILGETPGLKEQLALVTEALKVERGQFNYSLASLALKLLSGTSEAADSGSGASRFEGGYEVLASAARQGDLFAQSLRTRVDAWCEQFTRSAVIDGAAIPDLAKLNPEERQAAQALVGYGKEMLAGLAANNRELDFLLKGLSGGFIPPGLGGDLIRDGVAVLPTGRNIHSLDPWRVPGDAAWERGRKIAEALLETHRAEHNGQYPETIAQVLWGMDTIKTKGEAIATVIALMGARPVKDGQGKIAQYVLVPLPELGRPRIDVLMNTSGIFRDTFQLNIDLLDKLVKAAASADEPDDMNFIRKHVRAAMQKEGLNFEEATARIFSESRGSYGSYVDDMINDSSWESQDDLEGVFLRRNAHAYGGERRGETYSATLNHLLGTVERVAQEIDSVEYGLSDIQHYYSSSGALKLAAEKRRGSKVSLNYVESFTAETRVADAGSLLRMEYRTKLLNPRWYEGMLKHDHSGAQEIASRFNHMLGWEATTGEVDNWVFDEAGKTFVLDEEMRQRLEKVNPQAVHNMTKRLLEAHGRGLWQTDDETIAKLMEIFQDLEDRLEGLV
ncbi:MAG TPA: magnesium chelatase subunit H [Chloroflexia bacterium]|nr:magnesium chelatase subunit H [Chloroflexia bacterium]